jgi:hypothetical protein
MITYANGAATVAFAWPTNDTGGKTLRVMADAALSALQAAGYTVTSRPAFEDVRPADGTGYVFQFVVPATPPADPEGVTP